MNIRGLRLTLFAVALYPMAADGRDDQDKSVRFFSVAALTKSQSATPQISGGRVAEPKDWPASFYARLDDEYCTSTAVGPHVLLTAAHCVTSRVVTLEYSGVTYSMQCERSPQYTTSDKADWALCALDKPLPALPFEVLDTKSSTVKQKDQLQLTGFGCDGSSGTDNVFRIGESTVEDVPRSSNYDIVTRGGAAVCFGDSGGATFRYLEGNRRVQVAVNSRKGTQLAESFLSSLSVKPAVAFLRDWSEKRGVVICGFHAAVRGCRAP